MKTILFKIQQFPHLSETFILSQIVMAIEAGYEVNILVKDILNFEKSSHTEILEKYNIREKIIKDELTIPSNKVSKLIKALNIVLKNRSDWTKIKEYLKMKSRFSLTWIYEIEFYEKFFNKDVIHVQYGTNVHPVDLLRKAGFLKGRLIVSFHGHDAFFPINGFIENNGYYRNLFGGDNIIVSNTPYLSQQLLNLGCPVNNMITLPIPVNTNYFTPSFKSINKRNILKLISVGRLDPIKGHTVAIKFIYKLKQNHFSITLTIIGEGSEYENLNNQIRELGLENQVFLVGKKSPNQVRDYLRRSDIYLLTSRPVEQGRRETQGVATLEAQSCGLPVLAFDSGGVKYTIIDGKTGYLCKEGDIECLIEKFLLLKNKSVRTEMGKNARIYVTENYSDFKISKEWRKIYDTAS
jgi:colanic acid/amylovoran biosynthesis glycosyltransferase